jgi:hypothetical protein
MKTIKNTQTIQPNLEKYQMEELPNTKAVMPTRNK